MFGAAFDWRRCDSAGNRVLFEISIDRTIGRRDVVVWRSVFDFFLQFVECLWVSGKGKRKRIGRNNYAFCFKANTNCTEPSGKRGRCGKLLIDSDQRSLNNSIYGSWPFCILSAKFHLSHNNHENKITLERRQTHGVCIPRRPSEMETVVASLPSPAVCPSRTAIDRWSQA